MKERKRKRGNTSKQSGSDRDKRKKQGSTIGRGVIHSLRLRVYEILYQRGGMDIICMRRQRHEGHFTCTRSHSFSCLCSSRFVVFRPFASLQMGLRKRANTRRKLGGRPPFCLPPTRPPIRHHSEKHVHNVSQHPISGGRVRKAPESTALRHAVRPCIDAMMYDGCW